MLNHMFVLILDHNLQQEQDKVKSWKKKQTHIHTMKMSLNKRADSH